MGITVISQTTAERREETKQLFEDCKPYLEQGMTLSKAVRIIKGINHHTFTRQAWYKELQEYAETQGYTTRR